MTDSRGWRHQAHMRTWLALLCLAGCPDRSVTALPPSQAGEIDKTIATSSDIDILFVIDNSRSTQDKQDVFLSNFKGFIDALGMFQGGLPNLHIGVTTTSIDVGAAIDVPSCDGSADDGRLVNTGSNCAGPTDRYISDIAGPDNSRVTNYTGTLEDTFTCIANRGALGCGFEAPLEAIQRALDGSHPENDGFIRDDAFLAIIILTDEDDCSAKDPSLFGSNVADAGPGDFRCSRFAYACDQPMSGAVDEQVHDFTNCHVRTDSFLRDPASYFQFLSTLKDPSRIVVAVIGGDPTPNISTGPLTIDGQTQDLALEPSCHTMIGSDDAIGRPGLRLQAFVDQLGDHGLFRTVCQPSYAGALTDIGNLVFDAVNPCLEGNVDTTDTQPANPGVQPACVVTDVAPDGTQAIVPACAMTDDHTPDPAGKRPCWWLATDPGSCPSTATHLTMTIVRDGAPVPGTDVRIACAIAP